MLPIINGEMGQEIYILSNKYYAQILNIESQYSDHIKTFYEKNVARIYNDSIALTKTPNKPKKAGGLILGRMDYTMDFLIVDPD